MSLQIKTLLEPVNGSNIRFGSAILVLPYLERESERGLLEKAIRTMLGFTRKGPADNPPRNPGWFGRN